MKASDLRIGNYVKYNYFKKVKCISDNGIIIEDWQYVIPMKEIKPIPLTEEMLLKCGFEWQDLQTHSDGRTTKTLWKNTLLVQHHDNGLWSFIIGGYPIVPVEISQYLLQLQNPYYALTNEELIINL